MPDDPRPDLALAERLFARLAEETADPPGVTRDAYGPGERRAHALVRAEAEALGLEVATDAAGNLLMVLPGADRDARRVVLGSHLDSVAHGGNFDGAAGVLAGLAVVAGMRQAGFRPERDIVVLAIRAEEVGSWFPLSWPGSRAALGRLPPEALAVARRDTGRSLAAHMQEEGFDPEAVRAGRSLLPPASIAAYLELHIEQGPVLEAEGVPLAVVTGLPGSRRLRDAWITGAYNHSGATPRRYRADAAMALAELACGLDEHWARLERLGKRLVCTFCTMGTTPEAGFTLIPGEARFQLDIRSTDAAALDAMEAELVRLAAAVGRRRGVRVELGAIQRVAPLAMDAAVRAGLARAAGVLGIRHIVMPSGGGHDAGSFIEAGVPSGMLFVRNQNGSHNPHEAMRMDDFAQGCAVMMRWVAERAGGHTGPT